MKKAITIVLVLLCFAIPTWAQVEKVSTGAGDQAVEDLLANVESNREAFFFEIVEKWRETMDGREETAGWEAELTAALENAPADKLLAAKKARTYDEVGAALFGAWQGPDAQTLAPGDAPAAFGSTSTDLVYTPLTPCRIIDTRFASGYHAGRLGPNSGKLFQVNLSNFSSQGGVNSGCGIPTSLEVSGVVINVASTSQTGQGHLRVVNAGGGIPTAAVLNYSAGVNISNAVLARSSVAAGWDIYIYSGVSASHVVVDIMGYFAAPNRTRPDTYTVVTWNAAINNGTWNTFYSPYCPSGYRLTGGGHFWSHWDSSGVNIIGSGPTHNGYNPNARWRVLARNSTGHNRDIDVWAVCARIPGR